MKQARKHGIKQRGTECHKVIARRLLDLAHTDVNQPAEDNNTPLMLVAARGDQVMVDLLLDYNAKVFGWRNNKGDSAVKVAGRNGHAELAKYLYAAGLKQQAAERAPDSPGGYLDFSH